MSNYKITSSKTKTIRPNEPGFQIIDGVVMTPRAGFEISQRCPENYKALILECIKYGWLKPVATVKEEEYLWMCLKG